MKSMETDIKTKMAAAIERSNLQREKAMAEGVLGKGKELFSFPKAHSGAPGGRQGGKPLKETPKNKDNGGKYEDIQHKGSTR